jgi:CRISPR-associated endonuclease/helicase Cas3
MWNEISRAAAQPSAWIWAKSNEARGWHPLAAHMVDTVHVAQRLWDGWLAPATRHWLAQLLGNEGATRSYFTWFAGCHDLGKASPAFQIQVSWLADQLHDVGMPLASALPERARAPHTKVSAATIGPLLCTRFGWDLRRALVPAAIVGGHHGWLPEAGLSRALAQRPELYGWSENSDDPWMATRACPFELVVALSEARGVIARGGVADLGRARELTLSGYVILADWLASNEHLFPYDIDPLDLRCPRECLPASPGNACAQTLILQPGASLLHEPPADLRTPW